MRKPCGGPPAHRRAASAGTRGPGAGARVVLPARGLSRGEGHGSLRRGHGGADPQGFPKGGSPAVEVRGLEGQAETRAKRSLGLDPGEPLREPDVWVGLSRLQEESLGSLEPEGDPPYTIDDGPDAKIVVGVKKRPRRLYIRGAGPRNAGRINRVDGIAPGIRLELALSDFKNYNHFRFGAFAAYGFSRRRSAMGWGSCAASASSRRPPGATTTTTSPTRTTRSAATVWRKRRAASSTPSRRWTSSGARGTRPSSTRSWARGCRWARSTATTTTRACP